MKSKWAAMHFGRQTSLSGFAILSLVSAFAGGTSANAKEHHFQFIQAEAIQSSSLLPDPVADGSPANKAELGDLHALIASSSSARIAQAAWDDQHEDPTLFDAMLGFKLEQFPKTWALMKAVQNEAAAAADVTKVHFHRLRPWAVDPSLPRCDDKSTAVPNRSYPSGHATLGYTAGYVLAQLLPGRAQAILDRSADYALSRCICGVHYPSDTEASHVVGTYVAIQLMLSPAFRQQFEAASAELKTAKISGI